MENDIKEELRQIKDVLKILLKTNSLMLASISTSNTFNPESRKQVVEILKNVNETLLEMEKRKDGENTSHSCREDK